MRSKNLAGWVVAVLIAASSTAAAQSPQQPTGTWASEQGGINFYMGGATTDGTYLYIVGGYQDATTSTQNPYAYYQQLRRYDPVNNTWSILAMLPYPNYYNASAYYNGRIFTFGGYYLYFSSPYWYGGYTNMISAYSISDQTWSTLSSTLSAARYLLAAVSTPTPLGDRIYIMGGTPGSGVNDELNPSTDEVRVRASMPASLYYHALSAAVVNNVNKVYAMTGQPGPTAACYEYTPPATNSSTDNGTWATKTPIQNSSGVQQPRYYSRAFTLNNRVFLTGGLAGNSYTNQTYEYNPATDIWTQRANMSAGRGFHGAVAINGKGYVYGGFNSQTTGEEFTPPEYGSPPNPPTGVAQSGSRTESASQAQTDATLFDGWTNSQISFSANVTDPNAGQQVRYRVRVRPSASTTWTYLDSGLQNQGLISIPWTIPSNGSFDWEYRVEDSYLNSYPDALASAPGGWLPAFGNAISPDFRSDQIPPADPVALSPDKVDITIFSPTGSDVPLHWTESTDNGPVQGISYEIQVAREGGFVDIEAQIFSPAGTDTYPVLLTYSPFDKYWRLRARDVGGNFSNWSESLPFRVVYDDMMNHGAGDAKKSCGFSTGAGAPLGAAALCGLGFAFLGLAFQRRPPRT